MQSCTKCPKCDEKLHLKQKTRCWEIKFGRIKRRLLLLLLTLSDSEEVLDSNKKWKLFRAQIKRTNWIRSRKVKAKVASYLILLTLLRFYWRMQSLHSRNYSGCHGRLLPSLSQDSLCNITLTFTLIYLDLPQFTLIYLNLPQFTSIYLDLPQFTLIYLNLPWFTSIYLDLPQIILIYLSAQAKI